MWSNPLYRNGFGLALLLHLLLCGILISDQSSNAPMVIVQGPETLNLDVKNTEIMSDTILAAVSVNEKELQHAISSLQQEKKTQREAELKHQKLLRQQASEAMQLRKREEIKLQKLRDETRKNQLAQKRREKEAFEKLEALKLQKATQEQQLAALKKKQQDEARAQKAAEEQRIKKEKAAQEIAEQQRQAAAAARKAKLMSEAEKYKVLIVAAISKQWILPENVDQHLKSQFQIRLAPDGTVLDVDLASSSGNPILDRSAEKAIYKASPLPVPSNTELFEIFRNIRLTVRPENVRG